MIARLLKNRPSSDKIPSAKIDEHGTQHIVNTQAAHVENDVPFVLKHYAESIIASLNAGLIITNEALLVLGANDYACQILGEVNISHMVGQHLHTLLPALASLQVLHSYPLSQTGKCYVSIACKNKHLRIMVTEITCESEQQHLLITIEDISEEHRLREDALANAAHYRNQASLLDKASDAIIVIGINHHISFWNKAAEHLYGWTCDEAIGHSPENFLWDDESAFIEVTRQTIENGEWLHYNRHHIWP